MVILEVQHLKKTYVPRFGGNQVHALTNVNLSLIHISCRIGVNSPLLFIATNIRPNQAGFSPAPVFTNIAKTAKMSWEFFLRFI